jgi:hypothetical protein
MALESFQALVDSWSLPTETLRIVSQKLPSIHPFNYKDPALSRRPNGQNQRIMSKINLTISRPYSPQPFCFILGIRICDSVRRDD